VPDDSNLGQVIHVFRGIDQGTMGINLLNGVDFEADLDCHTETTPGTSTTLSAA
jgi:hypothetical protein